MRFDRLQQILYATAGTILWVGPVSEEMAAHAQALGQRMIGAPEDFPHLRQSVASAIDDSDLCDALVVQSRQLPNSPLALLNAAYDRLRIGAPLLLVIAPASISDDPATHRNNLQYLAALARRCGFGVADQEQSSELIVYRKLARAPRWRLDLLDERAIDGFAELFRKAFDAEMSAPLWHWKYGAGRGHGVIARRGERIVAHYGCTRRRALYFGNAIDALQMCDVMVDPRERGIMTKQGAMFLTAATMLELYLALQPAALAFGFPSGRSARLGERLGLYAEVGRILEVRWPASSTRPRWRTRLRTIGRDDPDAPSLVADLWSAMRRDLRDAILVIRDWEYLTYRYFDHPQHRYELILVTARLTGRPLGLLVLRRVGEALELLDLVAPLAQIPLLIDQARRLAGRGGATSLFAWITRQHRSRFVDRDATVADPDVCIPTNVWVEGPGVEQLRERWWLMSGDTEFH